MFVDFNILNQLGSPSINSNTFANRPSAGQVGRLFVSTDTFEIYRDTGTGWDLIGGPGSSTVTGSGAAGQVTYWTGTNSVGGENNLWWDAANNRFGVNTNTPTAAAEVVQTDGVALYSNFTTNAGSGTGTTALWAINNTNSSGYAAVIEEKTPNTTAGQYPLVVKHSLSSGTAGIGMGTGLHFQLPDDAGTYKTTQLTIETIDAAAATYKTRYRFMVQNNGSSTAVAYLNSTGLGLFTATPGAALDVHSTGTIAQFNTTSGTGNTYIAFQRTGTGIWRIGDTYNGGNNFFELHNTVLGVDAMEFQASTNKSTFQAQETYTTGQARGNYFDYNLSVAAGGSFSSPNAITSLGASLDLTLAGNATIPSGARSGLDAYNSIAFTGTGTLTQNQGSQLRTYANLTTGWAFNGSATGTITHLSGIHVRFPDNSGSAIAITNNYGLLINDQTANTGTVTYTNRWGVYQEGTSDLNYFAANTLIGTTTNAGNYKLQVNGDAYIVEFLRFSANTKGIIIGTNGAVNPYIQGGSGNQLFLGTSNNPRITILSTGEVGIATTTPASVLNVLSTKTTALSTAADFLTLGATIDDNTAFNNVGIGGGIAFRAKLNAGGSQNVYGAIDAAKENAASTDYRGALRFWTNQNSTGVPLERMRITSAGILQVGTTASVNLNAGSVLANSAVVTQGFLPSHQTSVGVLEYNANKTSIRSYGATAGTGFLTFNVGGGGGSADAEAARIATNGNFLIGTTTDSGYKLAVAGSLSNSTDAYLNTTSGFTAIGTTSSNQTPTLTVPSGQGSVICTNGSTIISWQGGVPSPYTQNVQIDIVFSNWGSNNVIGLADIMVTLRQWANVPGTAFGKVFATNTASAATFSTFNTTDVTTSQCTISAASGGNYTLRITIDPTNTTDRLGVYLNVQNGGIPGISSVTISYV